MNLLIDNQDNTEAIARCSYLAGLLDGDGCIYANKRSRSTRGKVNGKSYETFMYFLTVEISMCSYDAMKKIHEWFGGTLTVQKSRTGRPYYHWRVWNDAAVEVLKLIYPYLIIKKKQAALAFKFREVIKRLS